MTNSDGDIAAIMAERERIRHEAPKFIGLTTDEATALAEKLHITLRVIDLNANGWHTQDIRHDRMTADVKDGRVTAATAT